MGLPLTAPTVSTKDDEDDNAPSETVTLIVAAPLRFSAGVTVTERFDPEPEKVMFESGTRSWLSLEAVNSRESASASEMVKGIGPAGVLPGVDRGASAEMVGASLTGVTVRRNEIGTEVVPSPTFTVMVVLPA